MKRALVVGDLFLVYSARVRGLPSAGENFLLSNVRTDVSGVGANMSLDLGKLGVDVSIYGAAGKDAAGEVVVDGLRRAGVGTRLVRRVDAPTGTFVILVDRRGERTMIGFRGASETVSLTRTLLSRDRFDWVHVSGYTLLNARQPSHFAELAAAAIGKGIPISVDLEGLAQAHRRIKLCGVRVFCNAFEYREYFGRTRLTNDCGAESLIVKSGPRGSYFVGTDGPARVGGFESKTVDSNGAGDAFNAGFICAKLRGADDYEACVWGNACGSLKAAREGPLLEAGADVVRAMVAQRLRATGYV